MAGHAAVSRPGPEPAGTPAPRMECGVCWAVYDPALGDEVAQVRPGTPFEALPGDWCCPNCEAPAHKFMVLRDE
jgi:rubredoxin